MILWSNVPNLKAQKSIFQKVLVFCRAENQIPYILTCVYYVLYAKLGHNKSLCIKGTKMHLETYS